MTGTKILKFQNSNAWKKYGHFGRHMHLYMHQTIMFKTELFFEDFQLK